MPIKLNYDELPQKEEYTELEEGIYILEVDDIIEAVGLEGQSKLEMTHNIVGLNRKINYDNYVLENADGEFNAFGRRKLRAFVDATQLELPEITTPLLKKTAIGKRFLAKVTNRTKNENSYPQIHFAEMFPMSKIDEHDVLNKKTPAIEAANKPIQNEINMPLTEEDLDDI